MPSDTYTLTISDVGVSTPADGSVTTAKLASYTIAGTGVTAAKIESYTVAGTGITTAKLADGAITTAKILDGNVTTAKILDANVTTAKILDANVTTAKILDGAITTAKILDGTILNGDISANTITLGKIATISAGTILGNATGGTTTIATSPCTAVGFSLLAVADVAAGRSALGLGTLATQASDAVAITGGTIAGVTFSGTSVSVSSPTGVLPVANGGTSFSSYTAGDLIYANGGTSFAKLAKAAATYVLHGAGGGSAPSWAPITLTTDVTGTLPVANGGTSTTTSTGSGNVVLSTSPTLVTPVIGTPTSGTLTNCVGLPLAGVGIVAGNFSWATTGTTQVSVPVTGMTNTSKVFIQQYGTTGAENHAYMTSTASGGFTVIAGGSITAGKTYNYLAIL